MLQLVHTTKKASSNNSRGPEKPMTRTGWAAMRQKMTPWMLVEIISSDTPIIFSVLSAGIGNKASYDQRQCFTEQQNPPGVLGPSLPRSPPKVIAGDRAAK